MKSINASVASTSLAVVVGGEDGEGVDEMDGIESHPLIEYTLTFSDNSQLKLLPEYSKLFGMVEDFGKAMALNSLKAEIPMPNPFTKEAVEIVIGYFELLKNNPLNDPEATEYFLPIPVSKCIAAINTAEFMICNDFIKICSLHISRKLKNLEFNQLFEACSVKDMKKNLEKFRLSPACWILFGETMKELFEKEPNWDKYDNLSIGLPPSEC
uniref:Uncharacterized protein n=1 Tax=Panagrolaimus superbus TaxID=310955 RepID=A0A914YHU8_9BILA